MRLHAFVFACLIICARTASINPPDDKQLDALDDVNLDEVVNEPEQIKEITVNEVKNNLRNVAEIPVAVVEEQQLKKIDENSNDYVPDINESVVHKRAEIDLKNPGPPQRQEHETQNPGSYNSDMEKSLISVKEKLEETRDVFIEQLRSVSTNFATLIDNSENIPLIQQKIQNLNSSFTNQIADLNNTIQSYINPSSGKLKTSLKLDDIPNKEGIKSNLEKVQNNFDHGLSVLSEGVELYTIIKAEDEAMKGKEDTETTSSTLPPATGTQNQNVVLGLFERFQETVVGPIQGMITTILSPQQAPQTPQTPVNGQADEQTTPQRPILQAVAAVQNAWQNVMNGNIWLSPPSNSTSQSSVTSQTQPQNSEPQKPSQASQPQPGPLQQLIQNIRGIQNVVQRGQNTTTPNPNNPREKAEVNKDDSKGHGGNNGNNIDVDRVKDETTQVESLGQDAVTHEQVKGEQAIKEKPSSYAEKTD